MNVADSTLYAVLGNHIVEFCPHHRYVYDFGLFWISGNETHVYQEHEYYRAHVRLRSSVFYRGGVVSWEIHLHLYRWAGAVDWLLLAHRVKYLFNCGCD